MNKLPEKALGLVGLCRRSGSVVIGTDAIITALRGKKPPQVVIIASDASERTTKQLCDKCASYSAVTAQTSKTGEEMAHLLGKTGQIMAVGTTDPSLSAQIKKLIAADGES